MGTAENKFYRYPGVTPFTTEQSDIFFGRKDDIKKLYRLINRDQLIVLYGKSGLGKSSLLNAGIIPLCIKEKSFQPIVIRFGAYTEHSEESPLEIAKNKIRNNWQKSFLDDLISSENSLWYLVKTLQVNGHRPLLLLFDQFEELFSYPEEMIAEFQKEIQELLYTHIPLRFLRMADESNSLNEEEEEAFEKKLETRLLFTIRSDRVHLLDRLKSGLPTLLRHTHELDALTIADAKEAIIEPANADGEFVTPKFSYSDQALDALIGFMKDGEVHEERVEGILLQMLCENYEQDFVEGRGISSLDIIHIGDPEEVVSKYYEDKLKSLSQEQQQQARYLLEEGLVSEGEGLRISLHESYILQRFGIDKKLLNELVSKRLLRSEPFIRGGYTYELSHDRLVNPVIEARAIRRDQESKKEAKRREVERQKKLELAQLQAAKETELREKAEKGEKQAKQRTRLAFGLMVLSILLGIFSLVAFNSAKTNERNATDYAERLKEESDKAIKERNQKDEALINFKREQAEKELILFERLEDRASIILKSGGCPVVIFKDMELIVRNHQDSTHLQRKINSLKKLNPICK